MSRSHGHTRGGKQTSEYMIWSAMICRCVNVNHKNFADYGGRGITVCARWRNSFEAFFEDMGGRPAGTSIDRIDNAKGYYKENCRWATKIQQVRNKRTNRLLTLNGVTHCSAEWSELLGFRENTIALRIRLGWSDERILTTPIRKLVRRKH